MQVAVSLLCLNSVFNSPQTVPRQHHLLLQQHEPSLSHCTTMRGDCKKMRADTVLTACPALALLP